MQPFYNPNNTLTYGALYLRPINAQLTHDTEFFGRMDPYITFINSRTGHRVRTSVCHNGGRNPYWNEQHELNVSSQDLIVMEIWDHDTLKWNEAIAIGEIQVSKILSRGGNYQDYVPVFYRGKPAGNLYLSFSFVSSNPIGAPSFGTGGVIPTPTGIPYGGYPKQIPQVAQTIPYGGGYIPQQMPQVAQTIPYGGGYIPPQQVTETITYGGGYVPQQQVTETITYGGGYVPKPAVTETIIIQEGPQQYGYGGGHHHHHHHHNNFFQEF